MGDALDHREVGVGDLVHATSISPDVLLQNRSAGQSPTGVADPSRRKCSAPARAPQPAPTPPDFRRAGRRLCARTTTTRATAKAKPRAAAPTDQQAEADRGRGCAERQAQLETAALSVAPGPQRQADGQRRDQPQVAGVGVGLAKRAIGAHEAAQQNGTRGRSASGTDTGRAAPGQQRPPACRRSASPSNKRQQSNYCQIETPAPAAV